MSIPTSNQPGIWKRKQFSKKKLPHFFGMFVDCLHLSVFIFVKHPFCFCFVCFVYCVFFCYVLFCCVLLCFVVLCCVVLFVC